LTLQRFTFFYILFSVLLAIFYAGLIYLFPELKLQNGKFWALFIFIGGITFIAYILADLGIKRSRESGVPAIIGSIAMKMFFSIAFILIYSLKGNEIGLAFLIDYFSLYFLFSAFEIYCLLRNLRHQNK
jgi:hypothetical protein